VGATEGLRGPVAIVATFRDGLITYIKDYGDKGQALEAAGLSIALRTRRSNRTDGMVAPPSREKSSRAEDLLRLRRRLPETKSSTGDEPWRL
jgi:hypothetical protein